MIAHNLILNKVYIPKYHIIKLYDISQDEIEDL